MYDREHRFFASALVVSLVACVAFAAALGLAPTQKAYADGEISTQASGYTEVQLLEYINSNIETMLTGLGMYGENTSQTHPAFRWLYTAINQINTDCFQIRVHIDNIEDYILRVSSSVDLIRGALVADSIYINGQAQTTVRNYARLAAEHTDSMTTILQAWNRDMGASQNGTATDATWFSTVSSRLLATVNAINSANTNLISIDSKFWEYFLVPQRWQQQDGSYYYSPAYYFQYLQLQYDQMQSYFLTGNQISVDGTNYKTPHWYLNNLNDMVVNTNYYVSSISTVLTENLTGMKTDSDLLVKLFSQETVTINGQSVNTPIYYLKAKQEKDDLLLNALVKEEVRINGQNYKTPLYYIKKFYERLIALHDITNEQGEIAQANYGWWRRSTPGTKFNSSFRTSYNEVVQMVYEYLGLLKDSVGVSNNGWFGDGQMFNSFRASWNDFYSTMKDYLDSLIYLLETPDSSTSQQLIGDFDDEEYAQNMQQLRQQLGQVGVFSAVTSLGMIVYTISDADDLQTPSLDVPFEFAGSNDHLVIDLSWLDDFKPMINFACMALLFLQLAAWTVEAVKQT